MLDMSVEHMIVPFIERYRTRFIFFELGIHFFKAASKRLTRGCADIDIYSVA